MSTDHGGGLDARNVEERRTLIQVLALNAGLSAVLLVAGLAADSSGLMANALDNASDAGVYAIGLYAIGRDPKWKRRAATTSGVLLLVFAAGVLADAVRRFMTGTEPLGPTMIVMALIAAGVNALCIKLLKKNHGDDVNMRAAWTFSLNDFYSNFGIVVAGVLVLTLDRNWPDLVIGIVIALIALKGGIEILRDAHSSGDDAEPSEKST
jgi:cobalt-zinc-cadmium efflux system protein